MNYAVGTNPRAVATGDFNKDGKVDLAVVNFGDPSVSDNGSVSILFGNGDGTFQKAKNVSLEKNCTGIVVGDFDGDGNDDLALVRPGDGSVSDDGDVTIFLGNGDGTFRQKQVLTTGKNPSADSGAIKAVDLNGDQRLDLVVANAGDKTFSVLLGNGDGTFQSPVAYPALTSPKSVAIADLAGNGQKDLSVSRIVGVDLWLSNGDGTFRQGSSVGGVGVTADDFNGDKKFDLVTQPISICLFHPCPLLFPNLYLGNGDGTFQPAISIAQPANGAADFDGDGKLDLVGTDSSNGAAQILVSLGNGDGTFQQPIGFIIGTASSATIALVADVTADDAPDLVLLNLNSTGNNENTVSVLVNAGTEFSISAASLSPEGLSAGQSGISTVSLSLLNTFESPVSLTCSVQPQQTGSPTCSVSPGSVTFDATGKASAQLKVVAGTSMAAFKRSISLAGPQHVLLTVSGLILMGVSFGLMGFGVCRGCSLGHADKTPKVIECLAGALLIAMLAVQSACGTESNSVTSTNYVITVTGSTSSTQHSTTVSVLVR